MARTIPTKFHHYCSGCQSINLHLYWTAGLYECCYCGNIIDHRLPPVSQHQPSETMKPTCHECKDWKLCNTYPFINMACWKRKKMAERLGVKPCQTPG